MTKKFKKVTVRGFKGQAYRVVRQKERPISNPAPTESICSRRYFHGTPSADKAAAIMRDGIQPRSVTLTETLTRGRLAPQRGRIYLTSSAQHAALYGKYIFEVRGKDLCDVEPDEDAVGTAYLVAHALLKQGRDGNVILKESSWPSIALAVLMDRYLAERVLDLGESLLTNKQRWDAQDGVVEGLASGGKRMIRGMDVDLRLRLVEAGGVVAHRGALRPVAAWKLHYVTHAADIHEDGDNLWLMGVRLEMPTPPPPSIPSRQGKNRK